MNAALALPGLVGAIYGFFFSAMFNIELRIGILVGAVLGILFYLIAATDTLTSTR